MGGAAIVLALVLVLAGLWWVIDNELEPPESVATLAVLVTQAPTLQPASSTPVPSPTTIATWTLAPTKTPQTTHTRMPTPTPRPTYTPFPTWPTSAVSPPSKTQDPPTLMYFRRDT
jgi:hypothetical protein